MKKLIMKHGILRSAAAISIIASAAMGNPAEAKPSAETKNTISINPVITASKAPKGVKVAELGAESKAWKSAKGVDITVYPQTTIELNDKKANELGSKDGAKIINVAAMYDSNSIAFKIKWADGTENIQSGTRSDEYPDGFAVQMATNFSDPKKLPYIGMGSEGRPVLVHLQKAVKVHYEPNGGGNVELQVNMHQANAFDKNLTNFVKNVSEAGLYDYQKVFISEGFRGMTEIRGGGENTGMAMVYGKNGWTGMMTRSLKSEHADFAAAGTLPVAFALWDGEKLGRDGRKDISGWIAVKLEGKKGDDALAKELTAKPAGNIEAGKANVEAMCASCHTLDAQKVAPAYMAPNLSNIGGYSSAAYLAESIKDPSAVVVPGYNRNAHKNFEWYTVDAKGVRTSTMPPMMTDDAMISDAVAYLMTLKSEVKK